MQSDDPAIKKVGEIISKDLSMTAKILQMVNSAFFGLFRKINNPEQAVMMLGLETIKALVLSVRFFLNSIRKIFPGLTLTRSSIIAWRSACMPKQSLKMKTWIKA
jgi:c-di-GMP-related signal transduction protein